MEFEIYVQASLSDEERDNLVLWFSYLHSKENYSRASMVLAALSFLLKMQGFQDMKSFVVRQVAKGLQRSQPRIDTHRPVTFNILESLLGQLNKVSTSSCEVTLSVSIFFGVFWDLSHWGISLDKISKTKVEDGVLWLTCGVHDFRLEFVSQD